MFTRRAPLITLLIAITLLCAALTNSLLARGSAAPTAELPNLPAAQTPAPRSASYTGPGSCAASACHGAVRAPAGSRILQTEYTTWIAQDRHARAADVLSNPVSVRMAKILGLGAAHTAPKCLACHSLDAPEATQARTFTQEGVSCEACHGPASAWLGPHTTKGWTHAQSVQLGMYDTKDVVKRTELCLTCHLGTPQKFVDHEMIAAGHPDLVFDLEAFSAAMPRHWRTGPEHDAFGPVRTFAVGQLVHARAALDRLAWRVKGPVWPEYAELDCFACHHSLTRPEDSWRQAMGYENRRPGNPALNMARWATARHVLAAFDPASAEELAPLMTAIARDGSRLRVDADALAAAIGRARAILDRGVARALAARPDAVGAQRLFRAIAADAEGIAAQGERAAEQAAMAMETLHAAMASREAATGAGKAFDELFAQFQSPSTYDPRKFVAQVRRIEAAVAGTR
ncbi:MAG TPA: multiheme c-type cytochrome [Vicinamibacterales bacterium]|nr:multiheme c-type cytochrome [Vicinamibacterales bacterium]